MVRSGFFSLHSAEEIRQYILRFSPYSELVFFLVQLISVIFAPIPSHLSALAGGMLFGAAVSFVLTFAAVCTGSLLVFQLARLWGRPFADRFVSRHLSRKYQELLQRKTAVFLALAFLFPFFPDDILCILAGLTSISLRRFTVLLVLTRPWGLLFACALGGSALSLPPSAMVLFGLAGAAVFVLGLLYGDRIEHTVLLHLYKS